MGAVLAKFRKEKSTADVLERLETKIQQIEKYTLNTQTQKKRFVGNFLAISIGIYVIAFIVFYFMYFPVTWKGHLLYSVPMVLFPIVIIFLRIVFTWYFQRKLNKNTSKLTVLRDEKKRILEQVMDKETYKVAVNLLSRYGDKAGNGAKYSLGMTPRLQTTVSGTPLNETMRARTQLSVNPTLAAMTPRAPTSMSQSQTNIAALPRQLLMSPNPSLAGMQDLRRRTPFPIVNQQNKGIFERMVDILIGDGPQDRFAMICRECFAHNGMALKEEFDYLTFRCAFCNILNPARKERPIAPRLPIAEISVYRNNSDTTENTDSSSSSDDESVNPKEPKMTECKPEDLTELAPESASETVEAIEPPEVEDVVGDETNAKKLEIDAGLTKLRDELKKDQ